MVKRNIKQWGDWYYTDVYNEEYFVNIMKVNQLYVAKYENEIEGTFLLKTEDTNYWKDHKKAYYIYHFATKLGYPNLGTKLLNFIENLAKKNSIHYIRLDCVKGNQKLNEYYQNHGFKNRGEGEKPYPHKLWEKKI